MQIGFVSKEKNKSAVLLTQKEYIEAGNYAISKERLSIIDSIIDYGVFLFWIIFGFSYLNSQIVVENQTLKAILFLDIFFFINYLFSLPMELYKGFVLDKKYGFSNLTPKIYLTDFIKSASMFLIFGNLVIAGIAYIIDSFANWWIYGFLFIFFIIIVVNAIYPTLIAPMFNKFKPLEDDVLKQKIEALLTTTGFSSSGIFSIDASKRDNRLNAYFGGLGKTKRVVLFDTLISKLTHDELLAVLGHELGHFKNMDIFKNIAIMGIMLFLFFFIFGNLPIELFIEVGVPQSSEISIALFLLLSSPLGFLLLPIINYISRKNEFEADKFASTIKSKNSLITALKKLVNENKSFPKSHQMYIFFYYSHPPLLERLDHLEKLHDN
ncbi:MAG: M48 family metallopeptidase [Campylobacterales bacterium]|nr:M48 family metallopeptidase [Campylobacterales bacterium]